MKLDVISFGKALLERNDLDPIYVMLYESSLSQEELKRWLLAYWSFYHSGTSSLITDSSNYWETYRKACESKEFPRGHERRHFRAKIASQAYLDLSNKFLNPVQAVNSLLTSNTLFEVTKRVKTWYGFGDWIAFKIADMLERLDLAKIEFEVDRVFLFDSPKEGAKILWNSLRDKEEPPTESKLANWASEFIVSNLTQFKAPPRYERTLNVQEAETILCKWKSYLGGHYKLGEDVDSLQLALLRFPKCKLSQKLYQGCRKGGLW